MNIEKLLNEIESNEETHNAVKAYIRDLMSEIEWDIHEEAEKRYSEYYKKLQEKNQLR